MELYLYSPFMSSWHGQAWVYLFAYGVSCEDRCLLRCDSFTEEPGPYILTVDVHKKPDKRVAAIRKLVFIEARDILGHKKKADWLGIAYPDHGCSRFL